MEQNRSARKWSRAVLAVMMVLSVGGNVTHSFLADSEIHAALRIWPAAVLPLITFMGIEVVIRTVWERKFSWRAARLLMLAPAIPASIASYEHLGSLMLLMGERPFTAWIIPAAIDGMIVAATVHLIITRTLPAALPPPVVAPLADPEPAAPLVEMTDEELEEIVGRWVEKEEDSLREEIESLPPAPAPRALRLVPVDSLSQGMSAVELLLEGNAPSVVVAETGAGQSTVYRWRKALNTILAQGPEAPIAEKIGADLIEYMRERARDIEKANA